MFIYANSVGSPFDVMRPEGVLGLAPKSRSPTDPIPTVEHMFKNNAFGDEGRNMFALYFGRKGLNPSYIWFGGYSHAWLKTYLPNGANLNRKEIDDQIAWIDVNREDRQWIVPLTKWSAPDGQDNNKNFITDTYHVTGRGGTANMLLDTGSTFTHIPRTMYEEISSLFQTRGCKVISKRYGSGTEKVVSCKCVPDKPSTKHPTFKIQMEADDTKAAIFEYGPSQYFVQSQLNRDVMQDCEVIMRPNKKATDFKFSMGNTFFTKYFSVWDIGSQIDLVGVKDEVK